MGFEKPREEDKFLVEPRLLEQGPYGTATRNPVLPLVLVHWVGGEEAARLLPGGLANGINCCCWGDANRKQKSVLSPTSQRGRCKGVFVAENKSLITCPLAPGGRGI